MTNKIIKEYWVSEGGTQVFIIRSDHYGSNYDTITNWVNIAKKDFPGLKDNEIEIVIFGGRRYKKQAGIKFNSNHNPPVAYFRLLEIHPVLN